MLECAPNPPYPAADPAARAVLNYYFGGWTDAGTRVEIQLTPDTASTVEHYTVRAAERTVVLAFPQPGMLDFPGFMELHEGDRIAAHLTAADWGIDPSDGPSLAGIRDEHLRLVAMLEGTAQSVSTLASTLGTQRVREALAGLMRGRVRGKAVVEISTGSG